MSDTDRILHEIERVRQGVGLLRCDALDIERHLHTYEHAAMLRHEQLVHLIRVLMSNHLGHATMHITSTHVDPNKEGPMNPNLPADRMPDTIFPASNIDAGVAISNPRYADGSRVPSGAGIWSISNLTEAGALEVEALPDTVVMVADPSWVDPGDGSTAPKVPQVDADGLPNLVFNARVKTPLVPPRGTKVGGDVLWSAPSMYLVVANITYGDPELGHAVMSVVAIPDEA